MCRLTYVFIEIKHLHNFLTVTRANYTHIYCASLLCTFRFSAPIQGYSVQIPRSRSAFLSGSNAVFTLVVNLPTLVKARAVNEGEKCAAETARSVA